MTTIAGIPVKSTKDLLGPAVRLCMCLWAPPKTGKTTFAKELDDVTKKYMGKPTLFIAVEAADGGGTMTLKDYDVAYCEPKNWTEFTGVVAALQTDTTFGGIVLDNASDLVKRCLQPEALKIIYKDVPPSRAKGVPERRDYQTMGELLRVELNKLVNLTKKDTPENIRKHLIVTSLASIKTAQDSMEVLSIQPALPGQMSDTASAMFQTIATIEVRPKVVPDPAKPGGTMRVNERLLVTDNDGKKVLGDRMKIFKKESPLSLLKIWEDEWIPATTKSLETAQSVGLTQNIPSVGGKEAS